MNTDFFSKGHKNVTGVLVRKMFHHGPRLTEDPNTALNQTVKVQVMTENTDFPLLKHYITESCAHTDFF